MTGSSLDPEVKKRLVERFFGRAGVAGGVSNASPTSRPMHRANVAEAFTRFDRHPGYQEMLVPKAAAERLRVRNPFFIAHDGVAGAVTRIEGREYFNFSSYNYLGLVGHPAINKAAKDAIDRYGTSASASRVVSGERPIHRELEEALADNYGVEDCAVFVSGHATNVTTIGYLFGPKDLVIHDALIHNSTLEGAKLSGSARRSFPHNDFDALDTILAEIRSQFERVLIVVEGHYSMDGDIPDLPRLIDIKRRHGCFLMVDEAHSLGILGQRAGVFTSILMCRQGCRHLDGNAFQDVGWLRRLHRRRTGAGRESQIRRAGIRLQRRHRTTFGGCIACCAQDNAQRTRASYPFAGKRPIVPQAGERNWARCRQFAGHRHRACNYRQFAQGSQAVQPAF